MPSISPSFFLAPLFADPLKFSQLLEDLMKLIQGREGTWKPAPESEVEPERDSFAPSSALGAGWNTQGKITHLIAVEEESHSATESSARLAEALATKLTVGYSTMGLPPPCSSQIPTFNPPAPAPPGARHHVLLCVAWIGEGNGLLITRAAEALQRLDNRVQGLVTLRFERNEATQALQNNFPIFAKSWARGSGPRPLSPDTCNAPVSNFSGRNFTSSGKKSRKSDSPDRGAQSPPTPPCSTTPTSPSTSSSLSPSCLGGASGSAEQATTSITAHRTSTTRPVENAVKVATLAASRSTTAVLETARIPPKCARPPLGGDCFSPTLSTPGSIGVEDERIQGCGEGRQKEESEKCPGEGGAMEAQGERDGPSEAQRKRPDLSGVQREEGQAEEALRVSGSQGASMMQQKMEQAPKDKCWTSCCQPSQRDAMSSPPTVPLLDGFLPATTQSLAAPTPPSCPPSLPALFLSHSTAVVESNDPGEDRHASHPPALPPSLPLTLHGHSSGGAPILFGEVAACAFPAPASNRTTSSSTSSLSLHAPSSSPVPSPPSSCPPPIPAPTPLALETFRGERDAARAGEGKGLRTDVGVYLVLDGHGGSRASQYMSEHLIPAVLERLGPCLSSSASSSLTPSAEEEEKVKTALNDAFLAVDRAFLTSLSANLTPEQAKGYWNAGSCAVLALVVGRMLYVAHVGDCRAVLGQRVLPPTPSPSSPPQTSSAANAAALTSRAVSGAKPGEEGRADKGDDENIARAPLPSASSPRSSNRRSASTSPVPPSTLPLSAPWPPQPPLPSRSSPRRTCALHRLYPPPSPVTALVLTRDHNCQNASEVKLVKQRTTDKHAIRKSAKDARSAHYASGVGGIDRVAGSLAVTRALGNGYLKWPSLSFPPYLQHLPYITGEPVVTAYELSPTRDLFLLLASDGLWEFLSSKDAVQTVQAWWHRETLQGQLHRPPSSSTAYTSQHPCTPAAALAEEMMVRVARSHYMDLNTLKRLPRGGQRRQIHDDLCVTVVQFQWEKNEV
ncbi:protein phosphatase [Nannochloropsis gaditana]|uniref:Protein phosphatase n=1 Tax=Nannochloropsis gaditana TaxID=72520 RepID=W7U2I1_9STRA|nr:protein phosphatase [Nannochloropsis gaditana]